MARRRKFTYVPFSMSITLGTLADSTVIVGNALNALATGAYIHDVVECLVGLRDAQAGEGPIDVGFAHGDLSVTEIKEALTVTFNDPGNIIAKEHASRPVRKLGAFGVIGDSAALNDGKGMKRAIRFRVDTNHELKAFAYNRSGAALTTGAVLTIEGTVRLRWDSS